MKELWDKIEHIMDKLFFITMDTKITVDSRHNAVQ